MPWISSKEIKNIAKEIETLREEVASLRLSSMIYVGHENSHQYFGNRNQSKTVRDVVLAITDELGIELKVTSAIPERIIATRKKK